MSIYEALDKDNEWKTFYPLKLDVVFGDQILDLSYDLLPKIVYGKIAIDKNNWKYLRINKSNIRIKNIN